uniref:Transmembrane protein 65 n=1 Tax=Panagrolaimus davidi TaxID=227884 RepID=A0A914PXN9_9BILA
MFRFPITAAINKPIASVNEATKYISNLSLTEKKFILEAIKIDIKKKEVKKEVGNIENITSKQVKQLIIFNVFPFIGFGILDNMILIVAGQWINTTFGVLLGISTMAAAALGNILSDIAGVGLSYYVEIGVRKLGIHQPTLLQEQAESRKVRYIVNFSRAMGLTVGCLIGMFPLLFFE